MNVKRYLRKQAQEDLKALETEGDREFISQLMETVGERYAPKPKRNKNWLWAIPSATVVCAAVLVGTLVPWTGEIKFENKNFVDEVTTIETLADALNGLNIHISEDQAVIVNKTYDSVSGQDLYYTLSVSESTETAYYAIHTRIIVNEKYEFEDFILNDSFATQDCGHYSVYYKQEVTEDSQTGLNSVRCTAKIDGLKYEIYVTNYDEFTLGSGMFLNVIAGLFDFNG